MYKKNKDLEHILTYNECYLINCNKYRQRRKLKPNNSSQILPCGYYLINPAHKGSQNFFFFFFCSCVFDAFLLVFSIGQVEFVLGPINSKSKIFKSFWGSHCSGFESFRPNRHDFESFWILVTTHSGHVGLLVQIISGLNHFKIGSFLVQVSFGFGFKLEWFCLFTFMVGSIELGSGLGLG